MTESELLYTLETEALEAALKAAVESLRTSDLITPKRLKQLATPQYDGLIADAAQAILRAGGDVKR